jgi:ABC-2 type transport system permease protein
MYFGMIKAYWKESMAYRAEFMVSILVVPVRFLVLVMIWSAVYANTAGGTIRGYSLPDLITYFILTTLMFTFIYDYMAEWLGNEVRSGNFLIFMLKPISFMEISFLHKIANRAFAVIAEIIPILIIFLLFFKQYLVGGHIGFFIVSLLFAFVLSYLIGLLIGMVAFWLIEIRSLSWLINFGLGLASGQFAPLDLFPPTVQKVLAYLPFQYVTYVPVKIYLGAYTTDMASGFSGSVYSALTLQALWCGILIAIALFVWKFAIRRFSGVGA